MNIFLQYFLIFNTAASLSFFLFSLFATCFKNVIFLYIYNWYINKFFSEIQYLPCASFTCCTFYGNEKHILNNFLIWIWYQSQLLQKKKLFKCCVGVYCKFEFEMPDWNLCFSNFSQKWNIYFHINAICFCQTVCRKIVQIPAWYFPA